MTSTTITQSNTGALRRPSRTRTLAVAAIAAALICLTSAGAWAEPTGNLTKNWSFETPAVAAYTTHSYGSGTKLGTTVTSCGYKGYPPVFRCSQVFQGWTVTKGTVTVTGPSFWQTPDGGQTVNLNSKELAARIEQIVPVQAGQCYSLQFKVAAAPGVSGGVPLDVSVDQIGVTPPPALTQHYDFNTYGRTRTNMGYTPKTIQFMTSAGTSSVRLSFAGGDDGEFGAASTQGPVLDAVSLVKVGCLV